MPQDPRAAGRGAVIQGFFPGGRPLLPAVAAPPMPRASVAQQRPGPAGPVRQQARPRLAAAPAPVVQRTAGGEAFQLPAESSRFGGGPGQKLPDPVRQKMEACFGTSFADVRVHVGPEAPSIGALAFAQGSNLYFAPGHYNPGTPHGQQLLGHELTHVVQQRAGRVQNPFGSGVAVVQNPGLEAEASRMGLRAAALSMAPARAARAAGTAPGPPVVRVLQRASAGGGGSDSIFADTSTADYLFYVVIETKTKDVVYAGLTTTSLATRFAQHLASGMHPDWDATTHEIVKQDERKGITRFDAAVVEKHYIDFYNAGGKHFSLSSLDNVVYNPITKKKYEMYKHLHTARDKEWG